VVGLFPLSQNSPSTHATTNDSRRRGSFRFMNYLEAASYLYSLGNEVLTAKLGLRNISILLDALGNPQLQFPSLLIAGTNGKGSVAAFCESILREAGYRTGLYTSPHLERIEERIQIRGEMIPQNEFSRLTSEVNEVVRHLYDPGKSDNENRLDRHPTYFEMVTAIALKFFADERIELGILEVGLGGRYDATNVVEPLIAVITNVDYDHQKYLGDRLEDIAREKAGIIKPRTLNQSPTAAQSIFSLEDPLPVVYSGNNPIVDGVIASQCEATGAQLHLVQKTMKCIPELTSQGYFLAHLKRLGRAELDLEIPLPGRHQVLNALTAVCTVDLLKARGFSVNDEQIRQGIVNTYWPGRLEVITTVPRFILDGAHNAAGARAVKDYLEENLRPESTVMIFGAMRDKAIQVMGRTLFPFSRDVILTRVSNERSADPEEIAASLPEFQSVFTVVPGPQDAFQLARRLAPENGTILVVGSLFLVGELRRLIREWGMGNRVRYEG
jgi:dihydrofolate synthase/folylpolyglutamate synthase